MQHQELTKLIKKYSDAYYNYSTSLVTDSEFDELMRKLEKLEQEHPKFASKDSPTVSVGAKTSTPSATHSRKLLSLANAYNQEDLQAFFNRIKKEVQKDSIEFIMELKYDGVAVNLQYSHGTLQRALTRGDGFTGQDTTEAVKRYCKNLPLKLGGSGPFPDFVEIRGEIVIDQHNFDLCNSAKEDETEYSSKRNLASGVLHRKQSSKKEGEDDSNIELKFFPYGIELDEKSKAHWKLTTQVDKLDLIKNFGFPNCEKYEIVSVNELGELMHKLKEWGLKRSKLQFDIDGMVLKVNSLEFQTKMGETAKVPKWAIAYKFPAIQVSTVLKDIMFQVGRSGKVTPVGILDPITFDGATIQKVTLHNRNFIIQNNIDINRKVLIERSGDVIPKVVGLDPGEKVEPGISPSILERFTYCPCSKHYPLLESDSGVDMFCYNEDCTTQQEKKIHHFVSKKAMNIAGLGPKTIYTLLDYEAIDNVGDIFCLKSKYDSLVTIPGLGKKSIDNIIDDVESKKKTFTLPDFLYALGIPHCGKETCVALCENVESFSDLAKLSVEDLLQIGAIGEKTARGVWEFLNDPSNQKLFRVLIREMPQLNANAPL